MSAFEDMPPLVVPKKRKAEDIPALREELEVLAEKTKTARKKLKAQGSFDAEFWSAAVDVERKILEKTRVTSIISLSEFAGEESKWAISEEARNLFAQMRAQHRRIASYTAQTEALSLSKPRRGFREAFIQLFTTSRMGLGINTGMGKRDSSVQSNFRTQLLKDYESLDTTGKKAWCPVLHDYVPIRYVTASHIFSYRHGQAAMDSIFGHRRPPELFSSRNGILLSNVIEAYFDAGVLAIVPDLPDRPSHNMLAEWVQKYIHDYKIRIIDHSWTELDDEIYTSNGLKWRDLDNRPLVFKGKQRPAARYLYFHYCLQVLRRTWKAGPGQAAAFTLGEELGKPVWTTPGRYIAKNMLRAFVEELGHDGENLMLGARCSQGHKETLLDIFTNQIAKTAEENKPEGWTEEDEEDSQDEDDSEDEC
ncbi:uncharacterized protein ACLA_018240 [Aspergillus clavatus NRRL 1]|uniref:HNH nuclease domain-containing protein n=1 Tax=Aspergillus clavatus (strain ATCC 1007 / CBS 513.65 / DSM 816 / NCTC 3887 / NRRL 1 / QM 1276 / 107) TaxID=344612 RepID=A1CN99_ASPCL|nr:uncharacterized protein ACLA_018240 [Aspergillus clavatus NRRL 1]EAW07120.1 hypothetical protein ACLA_018240 [Aspergillus clavatus NRRL 1]